MKDRKEEILDNVCKKSYEDAGEVWNGQKHDYRRFQILLAMEQYAKESSIWFAEWLGENGYVKMWLGEKYVGWADGLLMKQNKCVPIEQLYQQYLESIPQPSK